MCWDAHRSMTPKYSICITHYNDCPTIERSLLSILDQIDDRFEVVVVDNFSTDGSREILQEYANEGRIRVFVQSCSRGQGRQIAFENSSAPYVMSNLDMDQTYQPRLKTLLDELVRNAGDRIVLVVCSLEQGKRDRQNVTIGPKDLISDLGGWRDVNYGEDWDLWRRAAIGGRFSILVFPLVDDPDAPFVPRQFSFRLRLTRYISMIQLNRQVFSGEDSITLGQRIVYALAWLLTIPKKKYPGQRDFNPYKDEYRIVLDEHRSSEGSRAEPPP